MQWEKLVINLQELEVMGYINGNPDCAARSGGSCGYKSKRAPWRVPVS